MMTYSRLAAFALLVGLVAACAPGGDESGGDYVAAGNNQAAAAPLTVEDIASQVNCEPRMQVDASDLRTGYCKTDVGEFFVNTFTSEEGKNAWMDQAPEYKPHLVGPLWTVLGDLKVLQQLQKPLKGDLHLTDHRVSPTPAAAG